MCTYSTDDENNKNNLGSLFAEQFSDLEETIGVEDSRTEENIPFDSNICEDEYEIKEPNSAIYRTSTFNIAAPMAYLIGIPEEYLKLPAHQEWYKRLSADKNCRIIRNLCMLRTAIFKNFKEVNRRIFFENGSIGRMEDIIPIKWLEELTDDGIDIIQANWQVNKYTMEINKQISQRIGNCKTVFPIWLKWDYIKEIFIMPNGQKEDGVKKAADVYYANKLNYPYQVYINMPYNEIVDKGNILYNDEKFVTLLYKCHNDVFDDLSKVKNISDYDKESIEEFLEKNSHTFIVVDCENSDPFRLYAVLQNLDLSGIYKIILCDDINTTSAWDRIAKLTRIPVEHMETKRVTSHKSLVDEVVCISVCREHYMEKADSVILFSSDSDYWALYRNFPEMNYFVMVEKEKFGFENRNALETERIPYCYIDNFCTGNSTQIKVDTMKFQLEDAIDNIVDLNINEMMDNAMMQTRVEFNPSERKNFFDKYLKKLHLEIDADGNVSIQLGE